MTFTSREVRLASRPEGMPQLSNFESATVEIADPGEGQFVVRNQFMSVDPYMRGRMRDVKSYVPPFQIGKVLDGGSVGEVVASENEKFPVGTHVQGGEGWREYYLSDGTGQQKVDPELAPLSAYLGVLGMPGLTAYAGLLEIGEPKEGETVMVSAAAGAVGSLVGQIAKIKGCRVVGSAGSDEKIKHLVDDLGFDAAFNYKTSDLHAALAEHCPKGIDVYFENVGGAMLEAVLMHMRPFARIPVCGMIAQYNDLEPKPGPKSIISLIPNRIKMQGFIVTDFVHLAPEFHQNVGTWLKEEKIHYRETIVNGISEAPRAFIDLLNGVNTGKMVVKLS